MNVKKPRIRSKEHSACNTRGGRIPRWWACDWHSYCIVTSSWLFSQSSWGSSWLFLLPWELLASQTLSLLTVFDAGAVSPLCLHTPAVRSWQSQGEPGREQHFLVTAEKFSPEPAAASDSHPWERENSVFYSLIHRVSWGRFHTRTPAGHLN